MVPLTNGPICKQPVVDNCVLKFNRIICRVKKRRAVSEVVAAVLLVAVVAAASFLAVSSSSKRTMEGEKTVAEALRDRNMQVQELIGIISQRTQPDRVILEIINYGMKEITLEKILVDGKESEFVLKDDTVVLANKTIPKKKIVVLEANMVGKSVQILTTTGNFVNVKIL